MVAVIQPITSTEPVEWTFTITVEMSDDDLGVSALLAEADNKAEKIQQDNGYTSRHIKDRSIKHEPTHTHITSTYGFLRQCQKS